MKKSAYICGPLTELTLKKKERAEKFYKEIADICKETMGVRGFVPSEHYDPIRHANYTPKDVDTAERIQVCTRSSLLIVAALAPSWGGWY